jgi:hypothetical protein
LENTRYHLDENFKQKQNHSVKVKSTERKDTHHLQDMKFNSERRIGNDMGSHTKQATTVLKWFTLKVYSNYEKMLRNLC